MINRWKRSRGLRWGTYATTFFLCGVFPPFLLIVVMVGVALLATPNSAFTAAQYGFSLPRDEHGRLPRSRGVQAQDAQIREFLARRQDERSQAWETTSLSIDEEHAWRSIATRWNNGLN